MALQALINFIIAFTWMFLHNDWSSSTFVVGYVIGIGIIWILRRFWPGELYLVRLWAALKLLLLFIRELILSCWTVIKQVLQPRMTNRPGIFAYSTSLKTNWEITLPSCLISLTPGTLTLEVSSNNKTLYIHAMDVKEVESLTSQIRGTFEKAIMEVTRGKERLQREAKKDRDTN
ncbi:Na+/H+ antiporter subunit E [Paenibacillus senegalensis]|uniref:Na+/H+ antiporter subunit E n=1 Tax=Paenibacillus senegalensis TaxID=1465766 RepID=UPI0002889544|nr:Na+/H+ antiporter subunit E [Paenibacillus senegalensis]